MSSSRADLPVHTRPERERAARPVRGSRPAARGSRRGSSVADDARGEGGADVPPADPHERRRDAARGRRRLLPREHGGARRRTGTSTTSTSTSRRSRACRPSGRTGCSGSPSRPGSASRSRSRPILATASPRASARAGRQEVSRTGPSRSASVRCGTRRRCGSSATSRGASTAPSASMSRCIRWPIWRPSRGGRGACTPSARTRSSPARLVAAYIRGFQGDQLGPESVACMTKHFPGGGPQRDGEDPHFPYGKDQVYPGGMFEYHLRVFEAAFEAGTAQIMPYYGRPVGTPLEEVGLRLQPRRDHGPAARALRLRRRRLHGLGPRHRRADAGRLRLRGEVLGRRGAERRGSPREDHRRRLRPARRRSAARAAGRARARRAASRSRESTSPFAASCATSSGSASSTIRTSTRRRRSESAGAQSFARQAIVCSGAPRCS